MAGRSGMTGDCHVPFCEGLEVKFLRATRLCKIDRPSQIVISDYDICIFAGVGVPSTYLESGDFACILNVSEFGGYWPAERYRGAPHFQKNKAVYFFIIVSW